MNLRQNEPVVLAQLIQTAIVSVIGVLVAFEVWEPTAAQVGALTAAYVAMASIVTFVLRGTVYAPSQVTDVDLILDDQDEIVGAELAPPSGLPHRVQRAINREK